MVQLFLLSGLYFCLHVAVSLPQIIFPSVVAVHKATGEKVVGMDAYQPNIRHNSNLFYPVQPSGKIEQVS